MNRINLTMMNKQNEKMSLATKMNDDAYFAQEIIKEAFLNTDYQIMHSEIDANLSGSTANIVLLLGSKLICANVGDSRAVIGCKDKNINESGNNAWHVISLSKDHKPNSNGEYERIIKNNGKILPAKNRKGEFIGPYRVWQKNLEIPGLAMSRSLGDSAAKKVGVISEPEVKEKILTSEDKFVIIGSDGIWQYLSNEEAVDIVVPFWENNDIKGAQERLIEEATKEWKLKSHIIDDITIIIIFFE